MYTRRSKGAQGIYTPGMSSPTLERSKCKDCIHLEVCIYRLQNRKPKMTGKRVEVFDTFIKIEECIHFLRR